ncbi:MAG: hypothetical protein E3J72_07685 [Planctomycetota bacterium]|nr:MAG: hypothetical protein E3J72_07685 [Planctomycetota bacterium]
MKFSLQIKLGICAVLLLALTVAAEDPAAKTQREAYALRKLAKEWLKLGNWCVSKKLGEQARGCADKAEAVDAAVPGLDKLREKIDKCETPDDAEVEKLLESWKKKLAAAKRTIAKHYEKLFNLRATVRERSERKHFDKYLLSALELHPTDKRWKAALAIVETALRGKDTERAANVAQKALALEPPEKYKNRFSNALDAAAVDKVILKTATAHPIRYYFSLPAGYRRKEGKKWPVLICVDGAGCGFRGMAEGYRKARGKLPYIVVSPCTFANTNKIEENMLKKFKTLYSDDVIEKGKSKRIDWDEEGILAIIKDLKAGYDAEGRVYVTGFSGGGYATYMMIFRHPDLLNGAAPACGIFRQTLAFTANKDKFTEEDRNFPIHVITGAKDPHRKYTKGDKNIPGIEPQTDMAEKLIKQLKYPNYKRTMVPNLSHSPARKHVVDTFKPYWKGAKKRSDKLK